MSAEFVRASPRQIVERKELQKRYEDDQELIMHQQRMLADGQKARDTRASCKRSQSSDLQGIV